MIMQPIARRPLQRRKHFQLLAEAPEPLSVDLCVETIQEAKKVFRCSDFIEFNAAFELFESEGYAKAVL